MLIVYNLGTATETEGRRISNWEVAKLAKLEYQLREKTDEAALEGAEERRVVSAIVARHWKHANTMIESAAAGVFP